MGGIPELIEKHLQGKIERRVGGGSYADVYKVRKETEGVAKAVKVVKFSKDEKCGVCSSLIRELAILREILPKHPNVIKVENVIPLVVEEKNWIQNIAVVMQCGKGDLRSFYRQNRNFTEHMKISITEQILAAVDHCHFHQVIHRDVKPDNILVMSEDEKKNIKIRLCDFGMACHVPTTDVLDSYVVSEGYRPPELMDDWENLVPVFQRTKKKKRTKEAHVVQSSEMKEKKYGMEVDIFACGSVLAELFSADHSLPIQNGDTAVGIRNDLDDFYGTGGDYYRLPSRLERMLVKGSLQFLPHSRSTAKGLLNLLRRAPRC